MDTANDNQVPLIIDNDDNDVNVNDNHTSISILPELVSSLGRYWDPPEDDRRVYSIYWVARLDDCFERDTKFQKLSDLDRYVLVALGCLNKGWTKFRCNCSFLYK